MISKIFTFIKARIKSEDLIFKSLYSFACTSEEIIFIDSKFQKIMQSKKLFFWF